MKRWQNFWLWRWHFDEPFPGSCTRQDLSLPVLSARNPSQSFTKFCNFHRGQQIFDCDDDTWTIRPPDSCTSQDLSCSKSIAVVFKILQLLPWTLTAMMTFWRFVPQIVHEAGSLFQSPLFKIQRSCFQNSTTFSMANKFFNCDDDTSTTRSPDRARAMISLFQSSLLKIHRSVFKILQLLAKPSCNFHSPNHLIKENVQITSNLYPLALCRQCLSVAWMCTWLITR